MASSRKQRRQQHHRGHSLGAAALRGLVGGLFVGHGSQKLFGAFDGPGLEAAGAGFEQMGLRPGRQMAMAAGGAELAGGALLALGAATPVAAATLTGVMLTAIDRVHRRNGVWVTKGGFEYNAVLIAAVFTLTDTGPGRLSVDHLRGRERRGLGWALFELGLGVAGFAALKAYQERMAAQGPAPSPEPTVAESNGARGDAGAEQAESEPAPQS